MQPHRSVALLLETSNAYSRGLLDGIIAYQREHERWSLSLGEQARGAHPPVWLKNWRGDGIIARIETAEIASAIRRTGLPVVDVSAARCIESIPWVETDDRAIAAVALEHLRDRGFRTLAYCGEPAFNWSRWREEHFTALSRAAGCECHVFQGKSRSERGYSWARERRRLAQWVAWLPKPVGVMACYDFKGQQVLDVCAELGIAVPEQVAVIGVDNDSHLCSLCTPPLTSVVPDTRRAGYEAARLLDQLMQGSPVPADAILVKPLGIVDRQSTDVYAIDDADVVSALRFIRAHACEGIRVADVLREVSLSRRVLESRFRELLGRTPHAEIHRLQMERACRLLTETDLPLVQIASQTGLAHAEYLSVAFKRHTGLSPRDYRRQHRLSTSGSTDAG